MMAQDKLQKLELTWIGKDEKREAIEPRILIEDPQYSYGDTESGNMLIHGDNLLALKALEQEYSGRVKCIYIDPPYNTGSAFEHYDDGIEHSIWLSLMRERIQILYNLLDKKEGTLWISLDDNEQAYCKVICDEIFGRNNFVANAIWEKKYSPQNAAKWLSDSHDFILVYAKNKELWHPFLLPRTKEMNARYTNRDNDPRGPWKASDSTAQAGHGTKSQFYVLHAPNGLDYSLPAGRCWLYTESVMQEKIKDNRIWFGDSGTNVPAVKKFLSEVKQGVACKTIWFRDEVGDNQEAKKEIKQLFPKENNPFETPKPERLVERILKLCTTPGDIVLDSFLGSGTTAAVAQKMGRKYIGVELGDQAYSLCVPRLMKVTDGTDQGGISKAQNWKGGSGFKFYELAPSLLKEDKFGNLVINKEYNADMLAAAMAKQEGYTYQPDSTLYWKQGQSSEHDYIYTTTQFLTVESLDAISETMQEDESLLICCTAFQKECTNHATRITVKKIPQMLLGRCEFNKDDYSLNIIDMPPLDLEEDPDADFTDDEPTTEDNKPVQGTLF
ncbi:MAG: site-specific DNA-methyltransferase [Bacteroidaceae bacterium]|nr:site-specific DNA-methyltransferase [Bacteroidaceae bacterium]